MVEMSRASKLSVHKPSDLNVPFFSASDIQLLLSKLDSMLLEGFPLPITNMVRFYII